MQPADTRPGAERAAALQPFGVVSLNRAGQRQPRQLKGCLGISPSAQHSISEAEFYVVPDDGVVLLTCRTERREFFKLLPRAWVPWRPKVNESVKTADQARMGSTCSLLDLQKRWGSGEN